MKNKLIILFIILISISSFFYLQDKPILDQRHYRCVDQLIDGTLYTGAPYCEQGPILYGVLSMLSIFGLSYNSILVLIIVLNICIFIILWSIIRREVRHYNLLHILLLYVPIISVTAFGKVEMLLCTLFFLIGVLQFYYEEKYWFAGLWFALSMLSKFSVAPLIGLLILYFVLIRHIHKVPKGLSANWKRVFKDLKMSLMSISVIIIVFFITWIWKPNVFKYALLSHMGGTEKIPITYTIVTLTNIFGQPNLSHLLPYLIIMFTTYLYLKERSVYHFLSSVGFAVVLFLFVRGASNLGGITFFIPKALYYLTPIYAIWIISFMKSFESHKRIAWVITIMIVFLPGYFVFTPLMNYTKYNNNDDIRSEIIELNRNFLSIIPSQERVLMDGPTSYKNYYVNADFVDFIDDDMQYNEGIQIDPAYGPNLIKLLGDQYLEWEKSHMLNGTTTELFIERYKNGSYSLIIISPPSLLSVERVIKTDNMIARYCTVQIPEFSYFEIRGRHHATLYFKNNTDCHETIKKLDKYYGQLTINQISSYSPYFANETNSILERNGLEPRDIIVGDNEIVYGNNFEKTFYNSTMIIMILLLIIIIYKQNYRCSV